MGDGVGSGGREECPCTPVTIPVAEGLREWLEECLLLATSPCIVELVIGIRAGGLSNDGMASSAGLTSRRITPSLCQMPH